MFFKVFPNQSGRNIYRAPPFFGYMAVILHFSSGDLTIALGEPCDGGRQRPDFGHCGDFFAALNSIAKGALRGRPYYVIGTG
jgi:hypothetical protein